MGLPKLILPLMFLASCAVDGDCRPDACADLQDPPAHFREHVMPILGASCAFSSCHGGGSGGLKLSSDADQSHASLVGVASRLLPAMPRVDPGKPAHSFLVHVLDASLLGTITCEGGCGDPMPQGGDPIPAEEQDTLRRWIAQGARND